MSRTEQGRYNARFAKAPANNKDLHRPLRADDDLDDAFAWKEARLSVAVDHAGAISTTRVSLKSADPFYEPSGLTPAR